MKILKNFLRSLLSSETQNFAEKCLMQTQLEN